MSLESCQNVALVCIIAAGGLGVYWPLAKKNTLRRIGEILFVLSMVGAIYFSIKSNRESTKEIESDKSVARTQHQTDSTNYTHKLVAIEDSTSLIIRISLKSETTIDSNFDFSKSSFKQIISELRKIERSSDTTLHFIPKNDFGRYKTILDGFRKVLKNKPFTTVIEAWTYGNSTTYSIELAKYLKENNFYGGGARYQPTDELNDSRWHNKGIHPMYDTSSGVPGGPRVFIDIGDLPR